MFLWFQPRLSQAGSSMFEGLIENEGVSPETSDLWCTYAAIRSLSWLNKLDLISDSEVIAHYLKLRQNSDGGFGWMHGMPSDAWATYYCTQALRDLGHLPGRDLSSVENWTTGCQNDDGGFGMQPGQDSDIWATYFCVRTLVELSNKQPHLSIIGYLETLQGSDGSLSWTPGDNDGDVRACYYGAVAATHVSGENPNWNKGSLIRWLRQSQQKDGGFTFKTGDTTSCMWATFRATAALRILGSHPENPNACIEWVISQQLHDDAFVRWPDYPIADVWAQFCAVGTLLQLDYPIERLADGIASRIMSFRIPGAGFTYREPESAADVLSTSAAVIMGSGSGDQVGKWISWLKNCILPNENGIMYMPGRGSEIRSTLWALCAGNMFSDSSTSKLVTSWLRGVQIRGSAFGYWEGRGADIVSTSAAVEILDAFGEQLEPLGKMWVLKFVERCRMGSSSYANVPGGFPTLRASLQAIRIRYLLNKDNTVGNVEEVLECFRVPGGGYANSGNRFPDLLSTYEAVRAIDETRLHLDEQHISRFLASIDHGTRSYGWTPMSPSGGSLAATLGYLLQQRIETGKPLLPLILS